MQNVIVAGVLGRLEDHAGHRGHVRRGGEMDVGRWYRHVVISVKSGRAGGGGQGQRGKTMHDHGQEG